MNFDRVLELLELDDELGTTELLRECVARERLYLVDRRTWLTKIIERMVEVGEDESLVADSE